MRPSPRFRTGGCPGLLVDAVALVGERAARVRTSVFHPPFWQTFAVSLLPPLAASAGPAATTRRGRVEGRSWMLTARQADVGPPKAGRVGVGPSGDDPTSPGRTAQLQTCSWSRFSSAS